MTTFIAHLFTACLILTPAAQPAPEAFLLTRLSLDAITPPVEAAFPRLIVGPAAPSAGHLNRVLREISLAYKRGKTTQAENLKKEFVPILRREVPKDQEFLPRTIAAMVYSTLTTTSFRIGPKEFQDRTWRAIGPEMAKLVVFITRIHTVVLDLNVVKSIAQGERRFNPEKNPRLIWLPRAPSHNSSITAGIVEIAKAVIRDAYDELRGRDPARLAASEGPIIEGATERGRLAFGRFNERVYRTGGTPIMLPFLLKQQA